VNKFLGCSVPKTCGLGPPDTRSDDCSATQQCEAECEDEQRRRPQRLHGPAGPVIPPAHSGPVADTDPSMSPSKPRRKKTTYSPTRRLGSKNHSGEREPPTLKGRSGRPGSRTWDDCRVQTGFTNEAGPQSLFKTAALDSFWPPIRQARPPMISAALSRWRLRLPPGPVSVPGSAFGRARPAHAGPRQQDALNVTRLRAGPPLVPTFSPTGA
jgi:hypothetical protein